MTLLESMYTDCVMVDKTSISDGEGGFITNYVNGATFKACVVLDNSTQARIGASQGVTNLYTVTTSKNTNLQFHDIFIRKEDNKVFRVTSDGDDKKTPSIASLDMRQVSAEEWRIPNE